MIDSSRDSLLDRRYDYEFFKTLDSPGDCARLGSYEHQGDLMTDPKLSPSAPPTKQAPPVPAASPLTRTESAGAVGLTPEQLAQITQRDALYVTPPDWKASADYFHFLADVHEAEHSGWSGWAQIARDRRALLAHVAAAEAELARVRERVTQLEPAAECWDALCACYRITCMGSAGIHDKSPHRELDTGYAHATFNLWTRKGPDPEGVHDEQDKHGRTMLADFMLIAIKNHPLSTDGGAQR